MNFTEDFVAIQGVLNNVHKTIGNFLTIKYRGGNEQKIKKVVEDLLKLLSDKEYLNNSKINYTYETELREINLFLILNTEFTNKSILTNDNKFAHLIDVVPQLSKCLLANVAWGLDFCRFYSEAIYSLPIQISVELLENCNNCIRKEDPYLVLEHVAMVSLAIYVKLYNIRNEHACEEKVNVSISKLLERFTELLQNFITPEVEFMSAWPTSEMYQYMGVAIQKILHLLKCSFNIFLNGSIAESHEIYKVNTSGPSNSPERLDKSAQALKKCNICLMSVCEANLQAVTVDVFCSWAEYRHKNAFVQQTIGVLAYEVREQLENFEGCGNLPQMLDAIMIKPKSVEDTIREADEATLLKNVKIHDQNQYLWFKALLAHGIMKSKEVFHTFRKVVHLCTKEDYSYLLQYCMPYVKDNKQLKNCILANIINQKKKILIQIIAEYFQKNEINNLYETDNLDVELSMLLNKLSLESDIKLLSKEIGALLLQNPTKFIGQLLLESIKSVEHQSTIIKILEYIEPVCNIIYEGNEHTVLTEIVLKFLKEYDLEPNSGQCLSIFINKIIINNMIRKKIPEELLSIVEYFIEINNLGRSIILLKIIQELPKSVTSNCDCATVILRLSEILSKVRWNFITYSEEKVQIVTEVILLINKYKINNDSKACYSEAINKLSDNQLNVFYLLENTDFLNVVSPDFTLNEDHNEEVCRLLKILPSCNPDEWNYISKFLTGKKNPLDILQLYIDVILILSEISKKPDYHKCLSYCFQQFCIIIKNDIYPLISTDVDSFKIFIKKICEVIKHLPKELQNTNDVSLAYLFDFEVLKTMLDDKDFMYTLISISHLEICKIICSKLI